jgi:hypothetical protein
MFGYIKGPKKFDHDDKEMVLRQGWNEVQKKFWIQITDRKTGITLRKWMDEEFYQQFHNMGNFTFKQTKRDEGEFVEDVQ